ncbi:MAG: hypothetical protein IKO83_04700 [Oscillospiraceae bacterium]|jgi:hypothetical protein|nr:hypothetical protein [Oscillospiraceae bacterium]
MAKQPAGWRGDPFFSAFENRKKKQTGPDRSPGRLDMYALDYLLLM